MKSENNHPAKGENFPQSHFIRDRQNSRPQKSVDVPRQGLILLDKEADMSSFQALRKVQKVLHVKKMGHAGTLDPFATGLLVLAIGDSTKALQYFLKKEKSYTARFVFGVTSPTLDPEGTLEFSPEKKGLHFTREVIEETLESFLGKQEQTPPIYSAVKVEGRRAYDLARKGEVPELKAKSVELLEAKILETGEDEEYKLPFVDLHLHVSSGFYIRSLVRDLAKKLGTVGLCKTLRRTSIGHWKLEKAKTISELSEDDVFPLVPSDFALPIHEISEAEKEHWNHGGSFPCEKASGEYMLFSQEQWAGIGEVRDGNMHPKKVIHI